MTSRLAWLLALALATGCGGVSYVYRTPVDRPLRDVATVAILVDPVLDPATDAELAGFLPRLEEFAGLLRTRAAFEVGAERFVDDPAAAGASVIVRLVAATAPSPSSLHELVERELRLEARIDVRVGDEVVATVLATAGGALVSFHGLHDADLERAGERLARRVARILDDLGLDREPSRGD
jgi:hypothetical protein